MTRTITVFPASAALLLSSCFASAPVLVLECTEDGAQPCPAGQVCINDKCQELCNDDDGCEPLAYCDAGSCITYLEACVMHSDCRSGWHCVDDFCAKNVDTGNSCADPEECRSGQCVDGFCCDSMCDGSCLSCDGMVTGGDDGTCMPAGAGQDPDDECAGSLACDGTGLCFAKTNGEPCNDNFECLSARCVNNFCVAAVCGDAEVGGAEMCDDGTMLNDGSYDGCNSDCTLGPRCGDGNPDVGFEECDDGTNDGSYGTCESDCTRAPHCGDGTTDIGNEDCDDGNTVDDGNGCSGTCTQNNTCSNGITESIFEACDDSNTMAGDYCSPDCTSITGFCGDMVEQSNEVCDDGTNNGSYDGCEPGCMALAPHCGDGNRNMPPEACDDGNTDAGDYCSANCLTVTGFCSDGIVQTNEECDDTNTMEMDGCTGMCTLQNPRWRCRGEPSVCKRIIFVDKNAAGTNVGNSWTHAFTDLQAGLAAAVPGQDEIWVAAERYVPGPSRSDTFQLVDGVALYGGFAGTETARAQRDWVGNETILSGDINSDDGANFLNYGENSYHVATADGVGAGTRLDGFTISGGNGDDACCVNDRAGGLYIPNGSPEIFNTKFLQNQTAGGFSVGGAVAIYAGAPVFVATEFQGNRAIAGLYGDGGAVQASGMLSVSFVGCRFHGNYAERSGSAIHNYAGATTTVINGAFTNNSAGATYTIANVGATLEMYNSTVAVNVAADATAAGVVNANFLTAPGDATIVNTILWNNGDDSEAAQVTTSGTSMTAVSYSIVNAWSGGGAGNRSAPPLLVNAAGGNVRINSTSSARNAGSNGALPFDVLDIDGDGSVAEALPLDLYGLGRIEGMTVDIGAAEYWP